MTPTTTRTDVTGGAVRLILTSLLLATLLSVGAEAPAPAPAVSTVASPAPYMDVAEGPGPDCITLLVTNMSDCQSYVMMDSNLTIPDKGCCGELKNLVATAPECLCQLLAKGADYGVDVKRALKLPTVCAVTTPPPGQCQAIGVTVPSDAPMSPGMSPGGLASSPSAGKDGSSFSAPIVTQSVISVMLALAIAFFPMILSF